MPVTEKVNDISHDCSTMLCCRISFPRRGRQTSLCESGNAVNEIHFMFCCSVQDDIRDFPFSKMSSICDDAFWWDDYAKALICVQIGSSFLLNILCAKFVR